MVTNFPIPTQENAAGWTISPISFNFAADKVRIRDAQLSGLVQTILSTSVLNTGWPQ